MHPTVWELVRRMESLEIGLLGNYTRVPGGIPRGILAYKMRNDAPS